LFYPEAKAKGGMNMKKNSIIFIREIPKVLCSKNILEENIICKRSFLI